MPELPDVEGFRRVLDDHVVGRPITRVDVADAGVLRGVSARRLARDLRRMCFDHPRRHGKWLIAPTRMGLSCGSREQCQSFVRCHERNVGRQGGPGMCESGGGPVVVLHFGMTGSLEWQDGAGERHPHDRVVFGFEDGELRYRDQRKLQGIRLLRGPDEVAGVLEGVGPDALDVSRERFAELVGGLRRQVKAALVDQAVVAGLGNLLADEILWRARVHPRRSTADLGPSDLRELHTAMGRVLRQSVTAARVPPRETWLTGHRDDRPGACPRCGTTLSHGRVGGRGTTWCPRCQPS